MKRLFTGLCGILLGCGLLAQDKKHDSLAILLVDRMTDVIGDLESCTFKLQVGKDTMDNDTRLPIKRFTDFEVFMSGPDRMLIKYTNDRGHRQLWYNGEQLAYYFREEHNYGVIPAPATTIEMIDSVNSLYHIEFPAADFFYPTFTDDLLADTDSLKLLGRSQLNGVECFHIVGMSRDKVMQFWITNDAYMLPARFVITYRNRPGNPQYEASFSNWQINPSLPAAMFDFQPPPGSSKVRMMSKNDR